MLYENNQTKKGFLELMEEGPLMAPCVYDCVSARLVENAGFKAMCLSGGELAASLCGFPDIGLVTLDELVGFDAEVKAIEEGIMQTSEETERKIDWTAMWAKRYPVLTRYPQEVETDGYTRQLEGMLDRLKREQHYSDEDAFLVLKDILAQIWNRTGGMDG